MISCNLSKVCPDTPRMNPGPFNICLHSAHLPGTLGGNGGRGLPKHLFGLAAMAPQTRMERFPSNRRQLCHGPVIRLKVCDYFPICTLTHIAVAN